MVRPTQFRKRRVGREVRSGELRGLLWADENEGRADPLPSFCANGAAGRVQGRSDPLPLQAELATASCQIWAPKRHLENIYIGQLKSKI